MTEIILKQGTGEPDAENVKVAEVAIDTGTGDLYTKLADGSVRLLNPNYNAGKNLDGTWSYSADDPEAGYFTTRNANWNAATSITVHNADSKGYQHNFALLTEGDIIVIQTFNGGGEYAITGKTPLGDTCVFNVDVVESYGTFPADNELVKIDFFPQYATDGLWEQSGNDIYYDNGSIAVHPSGAAGDSASMTVASRALFGYDGSRSAVVMSDNGNNRSLAFDTNGAERLFIDTEGDATFSGEVIVDTDDLYAVNGVRFGAAEIERGSVTYQANTGEMRVTSGYAGYGGYMVFNCNDTDVLTLATTGVATFSGNVGIGMDPLRVRVMEQLTEWRAKAKKAPWSIATDGAFDQEPTEELVEQWIETRAAGDKLQVNGNGSFTGTVNAGGLLSPLWKREDINSGLGINASGAIYPSPVGLDLGTTGSKFGDAYFSGTVRTGSTTLAETGCLIGTTVYSRNAASDNSSANEVWRGYGAGAITSRIRSNGNAIFSGAVTATTLNGTVTDVADHIKAITPTQIANWDAGTGGGDGGATTDPRITDANILNWNAAYGWGDHASAGYQPAGNYEIAGTAYTKAQSDAKYELKGQGGGGDYVPLTGDSTVAGTITATDFIATSDERVKDNITTASVGLIDSLNGREWDWKESGEKGSGVVAQEIEQVLPHLVHTDDDGMKAVAYNGLIGYLIEEVKALKAEVQELRAGN